MSAAAPRVLKKYPNRRLYDTERSRYVTLEDVRALLLEGIDIRVLDAETGEDITRSVLIQIITEQESGKDATFTTDMLARFIRLSQDAAQQSFSRFLDQSLRLFVEQQQLVGAQMRRALDPAAMTELASRNLAFWQELQKSFLGAAPPGARPGRKKRARPRAKRRKK
jgi:polyhydroxyalkanoate synthesis repressor PhaR